jgi:ABC-type cobalt transport system, ATPase component
MLEFRDLTYSYPGQPPALSAVSAAIPDGLTILAGPNAGGKTTLLRLAAGLLVPDSGAIVDKRSGALLQPDALRGLGRMVMQDPDSQILGAHVGEDIMLGRAASGLGDGFDAEAERLAGRFALRPYWYEPVESLSYGQKRKLCLMHALLAGPKILLLDEPFAGLDYPAGRELRDFIRENRRGGLAQIISTHELEPVFDLADWMVVVAEGTVAMQGRPEELRDRLEEWHIRPPGGGWA